MGSAASANYTPSLMRAVDACGGIGVALLLRYVRCCIGFVPQAIDDVRRAFSQLYRWPTDFSDEAEKKIYPGRFAIKTESRTTPSGLRRSAPSSRGSMRWLHMTEEAGWCTTQR